MGLVVAIQEGVAVNDRVGFRTYGEGTVVKLVDDMAVVQWDAGWHAYYLIENEAEHLIKVIAKNLFPDV